MRRQPSNINALYRTHRAPRRHRFSSAFISGKAFSPFVRQASISTLKLSVGRENTIRLDVLGVGGRERAEQRAGLKAAHVRISTQLPDVALAFRDQ